MNYKTVQKNNSKGKVAIIVVSIIMVIALATSAIAVYFHYFGMRAKNVFEDTKNLDLKDLEELSGVYFPVEDFSFGSFEVRYPDDFSLTEYAGKTYYMNIINLHKKGFGNDFDVPDIGAYYCFDVEVNGEDFGASRMEIVRYGKDRVEGNVIYNSNKDDEIVIYLLPYFYTESLSPIEEIMLSASYHEQFLSERHEELVVDGYCLVVTSWHPLDSLKLVRVEKLEE